MLEAYRQHVAERAAQGVPPKPLDEKQTAQLVELLKNPPAGEESFLVDLLENRKLIDDNLRSIETIARHTTDIAVIAGYVDYDTARKPMLYNTAAFMKGGTIASSHRKTLLPTYDVFDELRYFSPAPGQERIIFKGQKIGITVCEDIWNEADYNNKFFMENRRYLTDPLKSLLKDGLDLVINISASPYCMGKNTVKWDMITSIAKKYAVPVLYVNQVGGNDSLIFDGNSFYVNGKGDIIAMAKAFEEDLLVVDTQSDGPAVIPKEDTLEDIRRALVLGIRDYMRKCGFRDVVVGLSGGIDSALTAALAVEALGPGHVTGITMPSVYSSRGSVDDSIQLAENLGIRISTIPIVDLFDQYKKTLSGIFNGLPEDVTEENIQARIRGNLLMSVSNKFGCLLLTTGNKSELATGYCTLYGDMSGGLAVISDVPKTLVFKLAKHLNRDREIIPQATIEKRPSAELRENQTDQDSLPPYDILDQILECYVEKKMSLEEIVRLGFPAAVVADVLKKVNTNEYKRIQAAPGLKVTSKAFGIGRRVPIAQKFRP
ncbi:MAG TPA: NAD+ synthase [Spirochaetota bacterium]|nr:NAD+ synthase [Spirochaetota bacterium]